MAPKKKEEEHPPPPPEECLPPEYAIGCDVYWVDEIKEFENGDVLKVGRKGTLVTVTEISECEKEDGTKGFFVENVVAQFEGLGETHSVLLRSLSLEPAPLDILNTLSTGIYLPVRGKNVEEIWTAEGNFEKQARLLEEYLQLEKAFPAP